jgi:hypothetical protein
MIAMGALVFAMCFAAGRVQVKHGYGVLGFSIARDSAYSVAMD